VPTKEIGSELPSVYHAPNLKNGFGIVSGPHSLSSLAGSCPRASTAFLGLGPEFWFGSERLVRRFFLQLVALVFIPSSGGFLEEPGCLL